MALGAALLAAPLAGAAGVGAGREEVAAALSPEQAEEARALFRDLACGDCHTLADAAARGRIGPVLDGNAALDRASIVGVLADGRGAMPGFAGQVAEEDIELLAAYILQARR